MHNINNQAKVRSLIVNKGQIVEAVAKKTGLSAKKSGDAVNAFLDAVKEALKKGDSVVLVGFGSFLVRNRAARTGHNPRTRAPVKIPASKVPAFKAGKPLKDLVNK